MCYRTGTVRITNCATEQVQSALPEVQYSGHVLGKDVVKLGLRVDVLVAPVQEVLPLTSHHLQTEPHTHDHIGTVSVRGCGRQKNLFRILDLELNCPILQSIRTNSVNSQSAPRNKLTTSLYLLPSLRRRGAVLLDTHTLRVVLL